MAEIVRVYHGSRGGLQGAIRPVSDSSVDLGSGMDDRQLDFAVFCIENVAEDIVREAQEQA